MVGESKVETGRNESASIAADGASSRCVRALEPPMIGLMRVIEREIIPRLFLAHLPDGSGFPRGSAVPVTDNEIAAFAEFVLLSDASQIRERLESLSNQGVSLHRIYLDLVAPAARHLREFGDQDIHDVDAVSRGLARLRQVLGEIGRRCSDTNEVDAPQHLLM